MRHLKKHPRNLLINQFRQCFTKKMKKILTNFSCKKKTDILAEIFYVMQMLFQIKEVMSFQIFILIFQNI